MRKWQKEEILNEKKCSKCREIKLLSDFYKRSEYKGYRYLCKKCFHQQVVLNQKIWRHTTGRCKFYQENPRGKFSPKVLKKLHRKKYKYLLKNKGKITINIIQQVYEDNIKQYGTLTCYLCLKPIPFGKDHLEHTIPLSRGGTNAKDNLAIACQGCNCKKHNKTELEYKNVSFNNTQK